MRPDIFFPVIPSGTIKVMITRNCIYPESSPIKNFIAEIPVFPIFGRRCFGSNITKTGNEFQGTDGTKLRFFLFHPVQKVFQELFIQSSKMDVRKDNYAETVFVDCSRSIFSSVEIHNAAGTFVDLVITVKEFTPPHET